MTRLKKNILPVLIAVIILALAGKAHADTITFTPNPPSPVNLTTEGTADWTRWRNTNPAAYIHSNAGGTPPNRISTFTRVGTGGSDTVLGPITYTWSNGTPVATGSDSSGYVVSGFGEGKGFRFTVSNFPVGPHQQTLRLYVYAFDMVDTRLRVSAPGAIMNNFDFTNNTNGVVYGVFTVEFLSLSTTTITVEFTDFKDRTTTGGAVGIGAATLQSTPIPEPATMLLLGTGLAGLGAAVRKRRKKSAE